MQTIYCVEDDESIRELIMYALNASGFQALGFEDGKGFFTVLQKEQPSLALLDIMLPGDDGIQILKKMKENPATCEIPVILLTAKNAEYDKVRGLDMGADDYITKPFGVMELIARIKAVLRRAGKETSADGLVYQAIALNPQKRTVTVDGIPCTLTYKEFELLYYLMRNAELVLSRDKIMEAVWGFDFEGESRTVDMHIKSLRHKLGGAAGLIHTVRGVGYKIGGDDA